MNHPAQKNGPQQIVAMLGRWPEIGRSKTRLAAALGGGPANQIYRQLLKHSAAHALESAIIPNRKAIFFVDPPERARAMRKCLGDGHQVFPQIEGDLGRRARAAAEVAFAGGAAAVVVMGSSCPQLTPERIERAFEELSSHQVVLGPTTDGGLYLIGLSRMVPELFKPLQWDSGRAVKTIRDRCTRLGLDVSELEQLLEINRVEDLTDDVLASIGLTRAELLSEAAI